MKFALSAALLAYSASFGVFAAQTVTLEDGRQIMLKDDFTWHYVEPEVSQAEEVREVEATTPAVTAAPVVTLPSTSAFTIGDSKPTLQVSNAGIDLILGPASYQKGAVTFPTAVTNQSTQSVILVTVEITLYDTAGNQVGKQSADAWLAIKRLADTYLRPKQATQGRELTIAAPELEQYQIHAEITEVKTRSW
ncbi:DUF3157 family protein [Vibrio astriarenae]